MTSWFSTGLVTEQFDNFWTLLTPLHLPPLVCPPTGGLPEQHRSHSGRKLHLQPKHHHHGHGHLQQFGQLHLPYRSGRLAAPRHLLLPDPRHHSSLSPAALLLKPGPPHPPTAPSRLPQHSFLTSPPVIPRSSASLLSPSRHRDHKTNMDGLHKLLCPSKVMIKKICNSRHFFQQRGFKHQLEIVTKTLSALCMESKGMAVHPALLLACVSIVTPSHFGDARAAVVLSHVLIEMWTTWVYRASFCGFTSTSISEWFLSVKWSLAHKRLKKKKKSRWYFLFFIIWLFGLFLIFNFFFLKKCQRDVCSKEVTAGLVSVFLKSCGLLQWGFDWHLSPLHPWVRPRKWLFA